MEKSYNLVGIYNFLTSAFTTQEMSLLAKELFPALYKKFAAQMTKTQKVEVIVDYADKNGHILDLLSYIESQENFKYTASTNTLIQKLKKQITPIPFLANAPYGLQESFVGRKVELQKMYDWLNDDPESPFFCLVAPGGVGKSALAWHWHLLVRAEYTIFFRGAIWWDMHQRHAEVTEFLHQSLIFFGDDPLTYEGGRAQMDRLFEHLQANPILLLLDGTEQWLRPLTRKTPRGEHRATNAIHPLAAELLYRLATLQGKSKAVLLGRLIPRELLLDNGKLLPSVRLHNLSSLDQEDVFRLFSSLDIKTMWNEVQVVADPVQNHALTLRLMAGYTAAPNTPDELSQIYTFEAGSNPRKNQAAVLVQAYEDLPSIARGLLGYVAAFQSSVDRKTLSIIFDDALKQAKRKPETTPTRSFAKSLFRSRKEKTIEKEEVGSSLRANLALLQRRGMLNWTRHPDENGRIYTTYDLHPIIRHFVYQKTENPAIAHAQIAAYFESIPQPISIRSPADLAPTIDLYYHLIRANQEEEAFQLLQERLYPFMQKKMGVYQQIMIKLLEMLIPDQTNLPRLEDPAAQLGVINLLAGLYVDSGVPDKAAMLYKLDATEMQAQQQIDEMAISLGKRGNALLQMGDLTAAAENGAALSAIYEQITDRALRIQGHWNNGRLLTYQGNATRGKAEIATALGLAVAEKMTAAQSTTWAYRAEMSLLEGKNNEEAHTAARKALQLARQETDSSVIIHARWLLGWTMIEMRQFEQAEASLTEALTLARANGLFRFIPSILLTQARWERARGYNKERPQELAAQALRLAQRAGYQLQVADCYQFMTQLALDKGEYTPAQWYALKSREVAVACGYEPVLKAAEKLIKMLSYTS